MALIAKILPFLLSLIKMGIEYKVKKGEIKQEDADNFNKHVDKIAGQSNTSADLSDSVEEQLEDLQVDPEPVQAESRKVIAFVRGHNVVAQGAENYNGDSEFTVSGKIFKEFERSLDKTRFIAVEVIRPVGAYEDQCEFVRDRLKEINAVFSFHSHFNSADGKPVGFETLYATYMELKKKIHNTLVSKLGFTNRGLKKANRGFKMLDLTPCPSMIIEWCFGNHKHGESEKVFNDPHFCGKALAETVEELF